jgi:peptidoglycan/LPS O-acetylase OafA/YrhL
MSQTPESGQEFRNRPHRPLGVTLIALFCFAAFLVALSLVVHLVLTAGWPGVLLLPLPLFLLWFSVGVYRGWRSVWQLGFSNPKSRRYYDQDHVRAFFQCERERR